MEHTGMARMFKNMEDTGLTGFLEASKQAKSTAGGPEGYVETTPEIEVQVDNVERIEQEESSNQIEKETATNKGATVMSEINWVTYFLQKIDPADKGKGVLPYLDRPNPVEEHYLLVIQDIRERAECQLQIYDQWHKFRTGYRLNKIQSLKLVEEYAKTEDKLLPWAETDKVSELLQRRDLIWYKLVDLHLREAGAEHWKNFHKDKPSANQDIMAIRLLEDESETTRKRVNLFQARADLPVTYNEQSADRVASLDITSFLTWEEFKAQIAKLTNPPLDRQTDKDKEHHGTESFAGEQVDEIYRDVMTVEDREADEDQPQMSPTHSGSSFGASGHFNVHDEDQEDYMSSYSSAGPSLSLSPSFNLGPVQFQM
ncbi:putative glutamate--tRNA ligase, cytoplasmic [Dorcoceras hygrometricum]|uniref:Putative glutamate--tRNA ligase, cytoplasmic n=1 Tax=Dorcoceras hygrometricum TaxID=472368 RepID=A0A2Z7CAI1_9LAMI|nr:putative glutamate--tRNA ligase, cytoplasmic [Dorcoceras hygrometricum]